MKVTTATPSNDDDKDNKNSDYKCKDGYKKCFEKLSISGGICIKNDFSCPINDLEIEKVSNAYHDKLKKSNRSRINQIAKKSLFNHIYQDDIISGGSKLKTSKNSTTLTNSPIIDLIVKENAVCIDLYKDSISPNRKAYPLLKDKPGNCSEDPRYSKIDSTGE